MSIKDTINWGLDRAEVVEFDANEIDGYWHYYITVRDLTDGREWLLTWELSTEGVGDMTDHDIACMILAMANGDLHDFRNGETP